MCFKEMGLSLSVLLIRSDRGGSSGGLSRELSAAMNVPYISCGSHLLHNACGDLRKNLKANNDVVHEILHMSNYVVHGAKAQRRCKEFQRDMQLARARNTPMWLCWRGPGAVNPAREQTP